MFGMGTGVPPKRIATGNFRVIKVSARSEAWESLLSYALIMMIVYAAQPRPGNDCSEVHLLP